MKLLQIDKLEAGYGELQILKGVDMVLNKREVIAIIGPNGAGKSTVIKSIFNIANVMKGKIKFEGESITNLKTHQLMELGISYVPQGRINFSNLTVEENLRIGADKLHDKQIVQKRINSVYKKFPNLKRYRNELAYGLSGGEQQMLAIGRALIQNPKILLMDEPTLGLSPKLQKELFKTILKLKEDGISMIIVEQNAKKAIETADRTYLLENGKIALEGNKKILKDKRIKNVYLGGN